MRRVVRSRLPLLAGLWRNLKAGTDVVSGDGRTIRHMDARLRAVELQQNGTVDALRAVELITLLRPHATSMSLIRVGRDRGDGGYLVLDDLGGIKYAISGGIADDVTFESQLARRGLVVHCYDPSIESLPDPIDGLEFFKQGLSGASEPTMMSLEGALSRFPPNVEVVLKCDIEAHEWLLFSETNLDALRRCRQIIVEFHDIDKIADGLWWNRAKSALEKISQTHASVHVHWSNYFPPFEYAGITMTRILEVTYVRKDRGTSLQPAEFRLEAADAPHDQGFPETDVSRQWNKVLNNNNVEDA